MNVLVIDDDIAMTEMMRAILEPKAYTVYIAHSGSEGIEAARRINPEAIVLDLFMPGLDGWQVCKAIREFSRVPILVLSAMSKPGIATRALEEGADDYLIKPVSSGVLLAHLKSLIRRARAESNGAACGRMEFLTFQPCHAEPAGWAG